MLHDIGQFIQLEECNVFITFKAISFKETVALMKELGDWRIASIKDIQDYQSELRQILKDWNQQTVWVSDLIELESGPLNIPKFYSCDMRLNSPKNGSLALHEHLYAGLFFSGLGDSNEKYSDRSFDAGSV
jgi:hypothetical protein